MEKSDSSPGILKLCLGIATVSAGISAFHGICDANGIQLNENLETLLKFGPAVAGGFFGLLKLSAYGLSEMKNNPQFPSPYPAFGEYMVGNFIGGVLCAGSGGIGTLVGYGIGYLTGKHI